jgi:hypothetical protein
MFTTLLLIITLTSAPTLEVVETQEGAQVEDHAGWARASRLAAQSLAAPAGEAR